MPRRLHFLLLLLLDWLSLSTAQKHAQALIDWIRSKPGGFVSDKVEIRPMDPDDPSSPLGVFATDDIDELETILEIPRNFYLQLEPDEIENYDSFEENSSATMEEVMEVFYTNTCRLVHKLQKEMEIYDKNPEESKYGPFLAYLKTQRKGQLPATYSAPSKALLREISGPRNEKTVNKTSNYRGFHLPPWQLVDWIDSHFVHTGCIQEGDKEAYHLAAMAIQRGYDSEFIPVWDMFNHHNDLLNLDTNSLRSEEGLKVWADEDIEEGEELYATYNYCQDCYNVGDEWGTPGIFRDFGFVEEYPQMWAFLDHNIEFSVDEDEETGELVPEFYRDEETGELYGVPDAEGLAYLKTQLNRLLNIDIADELKKLKDQNVPQHEIDSIEDYYEDIVAAIEVGVSAGLEEDKNELCEISDEL